jgi:hypothetical protein
MKKRGKRSGYKGWIRKSVKEYDLHLTKFGRKIGYAKIIRSEEKWCAELKTDISGVYFHAIRSQPFTHFSDALNWLNARRKEISKALFG